MLPDCYKVNLIVRVTAEGFGLRSRLFCHSDKKKPYYALLAHFWPFLISSSNVGNF